MMWIIAVASGLPLPAGLSYGIAVSPPTESFSVKVYVAQRNIRGVCNGIIE